VEKILVGSKDSFCWSQTIAGLPLKGPDQYKNSI